MPFCLLTICVKRINKRMHLFAVIPRRSIATAFHAMQKCLSHQGNTAMLLVAAKCSKAGQERPL